MTVPSARQVAERFAAAAVDPASPELWDLYGPSVVMEMPFAPPGETFDLPFIMVMTVRDGHIVHSRDYSDPIVGARITGTLPRLVDALTAAP
jgi:hypothetical protein